MFRIGLTTVLIGLLAWLPLTAAAQTCNTDNLPATTPTSRFSRDVNKGTVLDKDTGLMWKICSEGQTWNSETRACDLVANEYQWDDAIELPETLNKNGGFAGYQDWRMPNIKELLSLVERRCQNPAINLDVFPNNTAGLNSRMDVWSSTRLIPSFRRAVNFISGMDTFPRMVRDENQVWLVRSE